MKNVCYLSALVLKIKYTKKMLKTKKKTGTLGVT
jgi:hypothetical protein